MTQRRQGVRDRAWWTDSVRTALINGLFLLAGVFLTALFAWRQSYKPEYDVLLTQFAFVPDRLFMDETTLELDDPTPPPADSLGDRRQPPSVDVAPNSIDIPYWEPRDEWQDLDEIAEIYRQSQEARVPYADRNPTNETRKRFKSASPEQRLAMLRSLVPAFDATFLNNGSSTVILSGIEARVERPRCDEGSGESGLVAGVVPVTGEYRLALHPLMDQQKATGVAPIIGIWPPIEIPSQVPARVRFEFVPGLPPEDGPSETKCFYEIYLRFQFDGRHWITNKPFGLHF